MYKTISRSFGANSRVACPQSYGRGFSPVKILNSDLTVKIVLNTEEEFEQYVLEKHGETVRELLGY